MCLIFPRTAALSLNERVRLLVRFRLFGCSDKPEIALLKCHFRAQLAELTQNPFKKIRVLAQTFSHLCERLVCKVQHGM